MILTMPLVRTAPLVPPDTAGAICAENPCCNRSTTAFDPCPPGVTYASGAPGSITTCGVAPVTMETGAITHGGFCELIKQVCGSLLSRFGFTSTMNPILVFE